MAIINKIRKLNRILPARLPRQISARVQKWKLIIYKMKKIQDYNFLMRLNLDLLFISN